MWARGVAPVLQQQAAEGVRLLCATAALLPRQPTDATVRDQLLYGTYLCGLALAAPMALHHRLAHVLGGAFRLPHAAVHTVLLPHTMRYNLGHTPEAMALLKPILGSDPAKALHALQKKLGCSLSLRQLGLKFEDVPAVVSAVLVGLDVKTYANPRPLEAPALLQLLLDAYHGRQPDLAVTRSESMVAGPAVGSHAQAVSTLGCPLSQASLAVVCVHGRFSCAENILAMAQDVLRGSLDLASTYLVAPQAAASQWYPERFTNPLSDNEPALSHSLAALSQVMAAVLGQLCPERVCLLGFSQGACLAAEWVARHAPLGLGGLVVLSGGLIGPDDAVAQAAASGLYAGQLANTRIVLGCAQQDSHVPEVRVRASAAFFRTRGATVQELLFPGSEHKVFPEESVAAQAMLAQLFSHSRLRYLSGFGNHLTSEALPEAVPRLQNSPQSPAYGLYAEQINGSSFLAPRHENLRTWFYRIHPSVGTHSAFQEYPLPRVTCGFSVPCAEPQRWSAIPHGEVKGKGQPPLGGVDFVHGLTAMMGAGSPQLRAGLAIYEFACSTSMVDSAFYSSDGDLLLVPDTGALDVTTEQGQLLVEPGECLLVPRGLKFAVALPQGPAHGFMCECYTGHFALPPRGVIGANGLADARHFQVPVARYEDREASFTLLAKYGGRVHCASLDHSPFDVVGWHGNYYPCKYNLMDFNAYG
jgi:predicted esterase